MGVKGGSICGRGQAGGFSPSQVRKVSALFFGILGDNVWIVKLKMGVELSQLRRMERKEGAKQLRVSTELNLETVVSYPSGVSTNNSLTKTLLTQYCSQQLCSWKFCSHKLRSHEVFSNSRQLLKTNTIVWILILQLEIESLNKRYESVQQVKKTKRWKTEKYD